ncbi:MAG: VOC family protein [Anaerolineae bacterium]|nr:VOC family protein [Anaerolineae bacterium]
MALDLTLNLMGVTASDWSAAYRWYTEVLGMETAKLDPAHGDWANLGGGWEAWYAGETALVFELFDGGRSDPDRAWGRGQGFRPAIVIPDLDAALAALRARGVLFTGEVETVPWGRRAEFVAAEGVRWALAESAVLHTGSGVAIPVIGLIEVKAHDLALSRAFYTDVIGLHVELAAPDTVLLAPAQGTARLALEPGGMPVRTPPDWTAATGLSPDRAHPVFISFMTPDVRAAAARFAAQGVTILADVQHHASWGGTDVIIADPDGHPVQVVQYP